MSQHISISIKFPLNSILAYSFIHYSIYYAGTVLYCSKYFCLGKLEAIEPSLLLTYLSTYLSGK